jgi:small-conductance mechanosensitive channel
MTKPRLGRAIVAAVGAAIALVIGYHFGTYLHAQDKHVDKQDRIFAYSAAGAFVVLGSFTSRWLADEVGRAISLADRASAGVIRLILTIVGVIVVLFATLAMLRIGVSQLLLGGAITGVVIGIAAQQSLGNMFAGIVLLLARPFRAGDHIRVRTGALGGPFEGDVLSMGLAYVTFSTEEGLTLIPNLTLLASGIVRSPRPLPDATAATASGQQPSPSTRVVPVPQPGPAASPGPAPQGSPSGPADPLPESSPSVPAPPACQPTP